MVIEKGKVLSAGIVAEEATEKRRIHKGDGHK